MSAEIQYWRRVTTQIWVVMLPSWKFASTNQKHYPDLGSVSDVISRKPVLDSAAFSGYFELLLEFRMARGDHVLRLSRFL